MRPDRAGRTGLRKFDGESKSMNAKRYRIYLTSMAGWWLIFGWTTIFYPRLMDLFQTAAGIHAGSPFADHVWFHAGLDIIAVCILLLAVARETPSLAVVRAAALASLMPTIAIGYSLIATPFWSPLFLFAGGGCLAFVFWGFVLTGKASDLAASRSKL